VQAIGLVFPWYKLRINFDRKMSLDTFRRIFSQTRLVTLLAPDRKQGDQISRIFACWGLCTSGSFFTLYNLHNFWGYFFQGPSYDLILAQSVFGSI
jgi:hypothetical protein